MIDGVGDTADTRNNFAANKPGDLIFEPTKIADTALMVAREDRPTEPSRESMRGCLQGFEKAG